MISTFLDELKYIRNVSPKTLELYDWSFKAFNGALEDRSAVVKRVAELRERGLKPVSVNTYLRCVNAYFMWMHKEHDKPLIKIPKLKEEQTVLHTLSTESVKAVIAGKPCRLRTLCCLLLDTGLRIDEALSLTRQCVDFDNLLLKVAGKGGKHRLVPFSAELRKTLFRFLRDSSTRLLFGTRDDSKMSQRNALRDFHKLGKRVGCEGLHPHMFRHTFAVSYLKNGGNLEYLRRILGHSDLKTTQKYLRSLGVDALVAVHSHFSPLSVGH